MLEEQAELARPIRVVFFGGGPTLERGARRFICRLVSCPEIEFLSAFCQSDGQGGVTILKDLWQRRGVLALPLLLAQIAEYVRQRLLESPEEAECGQVLKRLKPRIHFVSDVHAPAVLHQVRALHPDLGLVYGSPILKSSLFNIPSRGTLGIHHGTLPAYRGKKTTFWEMYNGEATAGVTIQKVNAGLDAGDIVKQGNVPVGRRSLGTVTRELESLGLELYVQAIIDVKHGTIDPRPQTGARRKLCRDPKISDLLAFYRRRAGVWLGGLAPLSR